MAEEGNWLSTMQTSLQEGETVTNGDASAAEREAGNGRKRQELAVPIKLADEMLGVFGFAADEDVVWDEEEITAVEAIVEQVGLALENQRLNEQTQRALAETQTLYDVSARLNSALGLQEVLEAAIAPAVKAGATSAGLWLFTEERHNRPEWQELAAVWGNLKTGILTEAVRLRIGEMPLAQSWGSGQGEAVFIEDVQESVRVDAQARAIFHALKTRSSCALPLTTGARQVGMITISWAEPRRFSPTEKRLYRNIAAQTAEVVEGRLLLQAAQERTIQLETLSRIEADLSQATNEADILRAVLSHFEDIDRGELHFVYLSADNQPERSMVVAEWAERKARPVSGGQQNLFDDLLAPLWMSHPHDLYTLNDVRRDLTLDQERREFLLEQNIRALVFLPFYSGGRWHGMIKLTWAHPFSLSPIQQFVFRRLLEPVGASLASRRAQLAQQAALDETATLYRAIAALNAARSYDEILTVIHQFSSLGQEAGLLLYHQFDRPWTNEQRPEWYVVPARLAQVEVAAPTAPPAAARYRFADAPATAHLRPDRPVWIENIDTDARLDAATRQNLAGEAHMKSAIFVPLVYGGEWTGNLVALYAAPRQFVAEAVRRFTGLCTQAAIAIQNLRLVEEAQQRAQRERMLREITERVRSETEAPVIVQVATHELEAVLDRKVMITTGSASTVDKSGSLNGEPGQVYTKPLLVRGEAIGRIQVPENEENPLTADEQTLLQGIAQQVAEALDNAWLLEQTQKRAIELETVSRVGTATSTILESERLLQAVVDLTKRSFNLYHVQIYLLDEDQDQLVLVAGAGEIGEMMKRQNWRVSMERQGLLTQVARTQAGVVVQDVRQEPYYKPNPLLPATRAELAVPMMAGNRLLGVFDVQSDRPGTFSDADVTIQNALATQVAIALQNAMLYEEQYQTAEKLREVERLKSEFLASMSHELRTPLNSIIGFADVLLEGLDGELNPRMTEDVQLIRDSGQYLRELIGDILDMSKIEAGKMKLRYELIDIPEFVDEIMVNARTMATSYKKEHLEVVSAVAEDAVSVYADRTRLKQVIFNLLSNALKFTETGQVRLSFRYDQEWLLVGMADTGIGIRKEDQLLIFEQFRQLDNTLTGVAGTGLGLPISKRLIELHGGQIWVESAVNVGTTFWFKIPRHGAGYRWPEPGINQVRSE